MKLKILFSEDNRSFATEFRTTNRQINVGFEHLEVVTLMENVEYYKGQYDVIPSPSSVVLPTAKKMLQNDVTVQAIPFFIVSNTSGGDSVYIGGEKEINIS